MKKLVLLFLPFFIFSCGSGKDPGLLMKLRVHHTTMDCVGEMAGKCLLVQEGDSIGTEDWEYFFYQNSIEGFEYEPGFSYDLKVRKIPVENPPADASSFRYELVEVISKEKQ